MVIRKYRTEMNDDRHNVLVKELSADYKGDTLMSPDAIAGMLDDIFRMSRLAEEHLYLVALSTKGHPLGVFEVSHGSVDASVFNPREIFIRLLLCGASMFVIAHNHPSGDTHPSKEDFAATRKLKECADMMGIPMIDHIIIGNSFYSFNVNDAL